VPDGRDDLLDPAEIEALLNSSGGAAPSGPAKGPAAGGAAGPAGKDAALKDLLGGNDVAALLQQQKGGYSGSPLGMSGAEALLDRAEADLAAAIAPDMRPPRGAGNPLGGAKPFQFEEFGSAGGTEDAAGLDALQEVELDLRIELGRTELLIEEVLKLREGSVVPLDKLAGDPVDILVNGRLIARGEVLVLNDNFCVRVAEILTPSFP
jgi:flagellar motor switch protein FliN/FliY